MKSVKLGLQRALSSDLQPFLLGPLDRIYDHDLGPSARTAVAASFLLKSSTKKFLEGDKTTDSQDQAALGKFLDANSACRDYALANPLVGGCQILEEVRIELFRLFGSLSLKGWFSHVNTGPKASHGAERYDLMNKLWDSGLDATDPRLHEMYRRGLNDARWVEAERIRFERHGDRVVAGAKLCFVPKQDDVSRIICVEPVLNGALQQALRVQMERCIERHYGINFRIQPEVNRGLAKQGSIDGSYATIDLSSASDYISIALCRYILPPALFSALMSIRSPKVIVPGRKDDVLIDTHMIGTMGNATTFPLQTAIFSAVTKAVARAKGARWRPQVFGDDIIVPSPWYDDVVNALTTLGFRVNLDKSFAVGSFRESCGGDYYLGYDVRGVYIKSLKNKREFVSAFNRLRAWSIKWGVPLFRTLLFLRRAMGSVPYVHTDVDVGGGLYTDFTRARRYGRVLYDPESCQYCYTELAVKTASTGSIAPCSEAAILAALSRRHDSYPPRALDLSITYESLTRSFVEEVRNGITEPEGSGDMVSITPKPAVKAVIWKRTSKSLDWRVSFL